MTNEYARRASLTTAVLDLLLSKPYQWITVHELAKVGGFSAWRTRVSDARHIIHDRCAGDIVWNGKVKDSAYRYEPCVRPQVPAQQQELFG